MLIAMAFRVSFSPVSFAQPTVACNGGRRRLGLPPGQAAANFSVAT